MNRGAYIIRDREGGRFILKYSRNADSTPRRLEQITSRLRAAGYPVPEYVNVGSASGLGWVIQSMLRGTPRPAFTPENVRELLTLNEIQAGNGAGFEAPGPSAPLRNAAFAEARRGSGTLYINGEVTKTFKEGEAHGVEIAQRAVNQDGELSVISTAVVIVCRLERKPNASIDDNLVEIVLRPLTRGHRKFVIKPRIN